MSTSNTPRERGILFQADMVRALLAGTKTQTRRALAGGLDPERLGETMSKAQWARMNREKPPSFGVIDFCPYGQVGDRLWVREAWKAHTTFDHLPPRDIPDSHVWYMADDGYKAQSRYRHGMFMPRWASRITLEITGVRVERLQEISESDALAEGVTGEPCDHARRSCDEIGCWGDTARGAYGALWNQINGAGSWEANPWVWVVEFRVLGTTTTSKETADG